MLLSPTGSVEYKCMEMGCYKVFTMKGGLRKHIKGHAGGTRKCNFCGKLFLYDSTLKKHENP